MWQDQSAQILVFFAPNFGDGLLLKTEAPSIFIHSKYRVNEQKQNSWVTPIGGQWLFPMITLRQKNRWTDVVFSNVPHGLIPRRTNEISPTDLGNIWSASLPRLTAAQSAGPILQIGSVALDWARPFQLVMNNWAEDIWARRRSFSGLSLCHTSSRCDAAVEHKGPFIKRQRSGAKPNLPVRSPCRSQE